MIIYEAKLHLKLSNNTELVVPTPLPPNEPYVSQTTVQLLKEKANELLEKLNKVG